MKSSTDVKHIRRDDEARERGLRLRQAGVGSAGPGEQSTQTARPEAPHSHQPETHPQAEPQSVASTPGLEWVNRFTPRRQLVRGRAYFTIKRVLDLSLVIVTLPILATVFVLCALAIKIESPGGPVMFTQVRTGKGGRRFRMYKFRSMVPNAEELKRELMHLNELQWPDFKITDDPRVTRIGKILRKSSLDELPQIINVIRGEMSLVGPRPTSFSASTYALWQTERLDVTPGLTGLWQIVGRGETEFDDRLRLDIAYIERRCLWLDIQILFRTVTSVLVAKGRH